MAVPQRSLYRYLNAVKSVLLLTLAPALMTPVLITLVLMTLILLAPGNPTPSFLILLAACYSGDIIFIQHALNDERIFRENTGYHNLVSSCLRVVSQQGHLWVMQYLLDAGFDVNHIGANHVSAVLGGEGKQSAALGNASSSGIWPEALR